MALLLATGGLSAQSRGTTTTRRPAAPAAAKPPAVKTEPAMLMCPQPLGVGVKTKGCSGLSYDLSWVDAPGPGDETVTDNGVTVLVDRKASLFLIGTVMDYERKAMSAGFTFTNPNEKGRCGCGESFHV